MPLNAALKTTRPSFLILSPVCVFLGMSTALKIEPSINLLIFFLILLGAIFAHISVNTLNEYYDYRSGLDLKTEKTAFSGGSGALPNYPATAKTTLTIGLLSLLLTIAIGIYFVFEHSVHILPIGIVGVALVITYTQWLNRFPFLCLITPGLGFGILMVVGTHVMLAGEYSRLTWTVSLVPFFLINNLLLLNQYPDIKADASVGRNTFPIAFGPNKSNLVYGLFALTAYASILINLILEKLPILSIIALMPMGFSLFALYGARKHGAEIGGFPRYLATNVIAAILTPLLLGIAILLG